MSTWLSNAWSLCSRFKESVKLVKAAVATAVIALLSAASAFAQPASEGGGEANLTLPASFSRRKSVRAESRTTSTTRRLRPV